ncbi:MAG: hypothetical protein COV07_01110 [Candidatus Vogelbacteria bacterium CG10_big_fil_rev_8_21_14_0_10_45_14]|uniref:DNA-formamidopyrimidine glycosylase n=1 Tax=Candidatus Vogelbacteria bacterium CG10_big_fil_rev_8_21_14_0_10_45_14 TaxID=1975042 RepID=A0A2H0RLZ9_9BACT|nr:MAG: hypothetical protein COV07_01110 [Candidatus Vogelbacteria bacterium CG10_big_fil_rev_8_21_14_0_10_45_14]
MPELPEVTTTVNGLNKTVVGRIISDVWADWARLIRDCSMDKFRLRVVGAKITNARRRAKNILIDLDNGDTILVHMKMTGHLLFGRWRSCDGKWIATTEGSLRNDPYNGHIRMMITFEDGAQLALSDLRRFAKVGIFRTDAEHNHAELSKLGPEPLEPAFTLLAFKECIVKKTSRSIKQVLLDQTRISGIGNIYADEMLFRSGIHPKSNPFAIPNKKLSLLYKTMRNILREGIEFGGDSMSDYRNILGERGSFQEKHLAYRRTGLKCLERGCGGKITRSVIGGRGSHFCLTHQMLYT